MGNRFTNIRVCLYMGWVFLAALGTFWLLSNSIPPYAPSTDAETIAAFIRDNSTILRVGMLGAITFSGAYLIWGLGISKLMEHLEGEDRVFSTIQLWGAGLTVVLYLIGFAFILWGAYRPEALDPSILQLLYDASWLTILVPISSVLMQYISISIVFLSDKREKPLIPRWVCWYNIWMAFASFGEQLMPFMRAGPFARHGIINFWFEASIYFGWMILMTVYGLKAVNILEGEAKHGAARP